MDNPEPRPDLVVGNLADYLGISAGKTNGIPVGILTLLAIIDLGNHRPQLPAKAKKTNPK